LVAVVSPLLFRAMIQQLDTPRCCFVLLWSGAPVVRRSCGQALLWSGAPVVRQPQVFYGIPKFYYVLLLRFDTHTACKKGWGKWLHYIYYVIEIRNYHATPEVTQCFSGPGKLYLGMKWSLLHVYMW